MRNRITRRAAPTLAGLALAALALQGQALDRTDDCADIDTDQARLACYDRLHGRGADTADTEPSPPATSPAQQQAPAPPQPPSGRQPDRDPSPAAPDSEAVAEVVASGDGPTGRTWFRLDSGELWEQMNPGRTTIDRGDRVRINRSPIGTHHMRRADGSSRSTQVRRLE